MSEQRGIERVASGSLTRRMMLRALAGSAAVAPLAVRSGAAAPAAGPAAAVAGKQAALTDEIRIAIGGDTDNLDPNVTSTETYVDMLKDLVFDTLADIADDSLEMEPRLAERWEVSEDAATYTFYLRQDARFHNGRPLMAQDVVFSFERAQTEGFWTVGATGQIASVEAVDDYTVRFQLSSPNAYFVSDAYTVAIVPEEAAADLPTNPVGSGPFRFVEHVRNDHWTLERFADYWDPEVAKTERLVIRILPDVSAAIQNLRSGDIHVVREVAFTDTEQFEGEGDVTVVTSPPGAVVHFFHMTGVNNEAILTNKEVRQALAWAMNREAMNLVAYGGAGTVIGSPLSPSLPAYHDPGLYSYDPARAREMLEAAGAANLEMEITVLAGNPVSEQISTIWQQGLAEAGVTATLQVDQEAVWLEKYLAQDYDVTWNVFPPTADPTRFFTLIIGRFMRAGVFTAENGYTVDLFEAMLPEARATTDPEEAQALLEQMQQLIADELPVLPAIAGPGYSLTGPNVAGWVALANGGFNARGVHLTE